MNYYLGIDIAKTNHVASLINNNGDVVIRAIKFTNSNEGFDKLLNTCDHNKYNDYIFARDIIWMTLNIIDYLVGFKQYLEAQRILEVFQKCGGFCKDFSKTKPQADCGCSR